MHLWRAVLVLLALPLLATGAEREIPSDSGQGACLQSGCHADLTARTVVHPPAEGGMCEACHEYTGTGHAFSAVAGSAAELCTACHDDPAKSAASVHGPVKEGECTACHDPHGSAQEALLTSAPEDLCTACHDVPVPAKGSVHPPVQERQCIICHSPHASKSESLLTVAPEELCALCHDVPGSTEGTVHPPVEERQCLVCHAPHSSDHSRLTRDDEKSLCLVCHEVQAEELERPHVHGVIESAGCTACHNPHAGPEPAMLHERGNDLCLECHGPLDPGPEKEAGTKIEIFGGRSIDAATYRGYPKIVLSNGKGHPLGGHPVSGETDPRDPNRPFWCGSCHAPHGAERGKLLVGGSAMGLCRQCHPK